MGRKGTSFVANVNGFQGATGMAKTEIKALENLLTNLKKKHDKFIQRSDWDYSKK